MLLRGHYSELENEFDAPLPLIPLHYYAAPYYATECVSSNNATPLPPATWFGWLILNTPKIGTY